MQLNRQIIIILILASLLISAVATAFYFYNKNQKVLQQNNELVTIYVARDDIEKNTLITAKNMGKTQIAKKFLLNTPLKKNEILGKYTKEKIYKNEMFLKQKLNTKIQEQKSKVLEFSKSSYNMRYNLFNNPNYTLVQGDYINIISVYPISETDFNVQYVANNIKILGFIRNGVSESSSITKQKVKKVRNKKVVEEVTDVKSDELILDIAPSKLLKLIDDYNKGNQLWMVKTKESIQIETIDKMDIKEQKELKASVSKHKNIRKEPLYRLYKPKDYSYSKKAVIDYKNGTASDTKEKNIKIDMQVENICEEKTKKFVVGIVSRFHIRNSPSINSTYKRVLRKNTIIPFKKKSENWYKTCDGLYVSKKVVKRVSANFAKRKLGQIDATTK